MEKSSSKSEKIVTSLALLFVGICFIVWADKITDWLATFFGILALFYAFIKIIKFVKTEPTKRTNLSLLYIVLSVAAGIMLISRADFIKEAISFIVGIYIILTCSAQLLGMSKLHRTKSVTWPIIGIIVGILCITGQFIIPNEIARIIGVALIIYAIVYLTGTFTIESSIRRSSRKTGHKGIGETATIKEAEIVKPKKASTKKEK